MKKIIATTVAAAALISGSAFAAGAQTGLVMGANLGLATPTGNLKGDDLYNSAKNNPFVTSASQDTGNIAGGLFIGYDYALNPMLAVGIELGGQYAYEVTKIKVSDASGNSLSLKASVISVPLFLTGKFYIPHTGGLNVFAKAGYAYNRINVTLDTTGLPSQDDHQTLWRPVIAGGIGYQLQQFNIFAQYQYNWLPYNGQNSGLGTLSAGVAYTLPM
ncbi:outer membrane protein [Cysteiniphilum sp. JM-1]|uniref:outer membrane protein n=1 Tax=Cysteiniphilum sp. JM-1 TaxID=2610891 RepID=UPI001248F40C|nr:outer membrane beta-barrel protein [Cysteiniphilum sp. JM-1]